MIKPYGDPTRPIWFVGSYPSVKDAQAGEYMAGSVGEVLWNIIDTADIPEEHVFVYPLLNRYPQSRWKDTYKQEHFCSNKDHLVMKFIPFGPENNRKFISPYLAKSIQTLYKLIKEHKPRMIIGLGEYPLFALSGNSGVTNWRGSCLSILGCKFIPTLDPEKIMKVWEWKFFATQDVRRAKREAQRRAWNFPEENFEVYPSYREVLTRLKVLQDKANKEQLDLGVDIETRLKLMTCIGIAWSPTEAICIPFTSHEKSSYWSPSQELMIVKLLHKLLTHPNVECHGQNFIYDMQYIVRYMGFVPRLGMDTMTAWHVAYAGLPKALYFICSMMLPKYVYWKDEGKGHKPSPEQERNYFIYNCKDAARTLQLIPILKRLIHRRRLIPQYEQQMRGIMTRLRMMMRGVRRDKKLQAPMALECMELMREREGHFRKFTDALTGGQPLVKSKKPAPWWSSETQQKKIFYEILKVKTVRDRKNNNRPTTNDAALKTIGEREPLLKPLCMWIQEYRSLGIFLGTFVNMKTDHDDRMRCSYGCGMTETFRDTSSEDAFDYGGNLQNLPKGNE